jgi:glycine hydroxymethyltransferase
MCKAEHAKAVDKAVFPGLQGGPLMHVIAAKAVAFKEALEPGFKTYQQQVVNNARALAGGLEKRGFRIVSGGTDNHLMLVDVSGKGVTGKEAEAALDEAGITVNKNAIPYDQKPPAIASGIRLGTPLVSTRGMREGEMEQIADAIDQVLSNPGDSGVRKLIRSRVRVLCGRFPIFSEYR